MHSDSIPNADHGFSADLAGGDDSLVRRESNGSDVVNMCIHESLSVSCRVVAHSQASCLINNRLVLDNANIISGVSASIPVNPFKLEIDLRWGVLLGGRFKEA